MDSIEHNPVLFRLYPEKEFQVGKERWRSLESAQQQQKTQIWRARAHAHTVLYKISAVNNLILFNKYFQAYFRMLKN